MGLVSVLLVRLCVVAFVLIFLQIAITVVRAVARALRARSVVRALVFCPAQGDKQSALARVLIHKQTANTAVVAAIFVRVAKTAKVALVSVQVDLQTVVELVWTQRAIKCTAVDAEMPVVLDFSVSLECVLSHAQWVKRPAVGRA